MVAHDRPPDQRRKRPAGGKVFFANSGAEANECAIKLARRWAGRGRHVVISTDNSFHGRTLATLHRDRAAREAERRSPRSPRASCTSPTTTSPRSTRRSTPDTVAGVLLEPIQGEGGVVRAGPDYLGAVRALCTERNASC